MPEPDPGCVKSIAGTRWHWFARSRYECPISSAPWLRWLKFSQWSG